MVNFGVFVIFIIGHFSSLIVVNATCGFVPIIFSIAFLFLRESPAMLIYKNRIEDAKECILFLRGESYNYQAEIDDLKIRIQTVKDRLGFRRVFSTKPTRKALFLIMGMFFFFQMSGINILPFYSNLIFTEAGFEFLAGISSIIVAGMQVISCLFSLACVDRFGRRPLLIFSTALMSLSLVGIGTYFYLKEISVDVSSFMYLPLTLFCIFVIAFSIGLAPVTYVLLGEIFVFEAKMYVAPLTKVVNFLLAFMIALTFVLLVSSVGFGITFYIFAGFNFLGCIYVFIFIPETKGATLAEIQTILGM
jgi:MFS family permease